MILEGQKVKILDDPDYPEFVGLKGIIFRINENFVYKHRVVLWVPKLENYVFVSYREEDIQPIYEDGDGTDYGRD